MEEAQEALEAIARTQARFDELVDRFESKIEETENELENAKKNLRSEGQENPLTMVSIVLCFCIGFGISFIF